MPLGLIPHSHENRPGRNSEKLYIMSSFPIFKVMRKKVSLSKPGTGRPVTIWIDKDCLPQFEVLAAERGLSRSALMRVLVLDFVKASINETSAAVNY